MKLPLWARTLDAAAILLAIVALSVAFTGGFRISVFGARLSITEWWRPIVLFAIVTGARYAFVRRDPLHARVAAGVAAWWRSHDTRAVLPIHLGSRVGVLLIGFAAVILIGFPPEASNRWRIYSNDLLDLPARWDAGWYLGIANTGYSYASDSTGQYQQNIAFFPAYPMAMRVVSPLMGRHTLWTGVLIAIVAFYFALVYLLRLARSELGNEEQAAAAVALIAAYPFAVFFSAPYTESLFLLTLVAAVYHFRQNELGRAAAWGFVCGLTRPPGCLLSVALGLMAIAPAWDAARWRPVLPPPMGWPQLARRLLAASAPGLGMLAFSAFIYQLTGNAFQWTMQNAAWGRVYRGLDTVVSDRLSFIADHGFYQYASTQTIDLFYGIAVVLCLAAVWPVYRRFGLPYAVLIVLNLLPPMAAGGMLSMGRVTAVLFPVFLWLGAAIPARHRVAWITAFALFQGFAAVMFFTWRPLF